MGNYILKNKTDLTSMRFYRKILLRKKYEKRASGTGRSENNKSALFVQRIKGKRKG